MKATTGLPPDAERRIASIELRSGSRGETIVGYAAVFGKRSLDLGGFTEIIEAGAFRDALVNCDCRALLNHNPDFVLGRTTSGTLRIMEDDVGLFTETQPPDTQLVRDMVLTPMRRGDLTEMSFAFRVAPGGATTKEIDGVFVRTILPGGVERLFDISPVTYAAYPDTTVAVRSMQHLKGHSQRLARIAYMARSNRIAAMWEDPIRRPFPGQYEPNRVVARQARDMGSVPRTACHKPRWPRRMSF